MLIKCPYCFGEFHDYEVHFRSEKIVTQNELDGLYPEEYDSYDDFLAKYTKPDKKKIIDEYTDAQFFASEISEKYKKFWSDYNNDFTEQDPTDKYFGVKSYERKVIIPDNEAHQIYLNKQSNGSYLIKDKSGMVSKIQLKNDLQTCHRRVCPHCHNPLPEEYGRNEVKFISVIGVSNSGKTVFLSQLLRNMSKIGAKVALTINVMNPFTSKFINDNRIDVNLPMPQGTPVKVFLQPLFYNVEYLDSNGKKKQTTFVLYDVAGEIFETENVGLVPLFAKFIEHSNGLMVLIDPSQIEHIGLGTRTDKEIENTEAVFNAIRSIMSSGTEEKCKIPLAVCVSKTDSEGIKNAFGLHLSGLLLNEVTGIRNSETNRPLRKFNAKEYNNIADGLNDFFLRFMETVHNLLYTGYETYAYFGFSALGCDTEERVGIDGRKQKFPIGPILPMRLEEPILWLFNKLGYIGTDVEIHDSERIIIKCPHCSSEDYVKLHDSDREEVVKKGFLGLGKQITYYDYLCRDCNRKFNYEKRR